jgi:hypothetical protein
MKATMTRPSASVEWDRMPSSASVESAPLFCSRSSASETSAATTKTPIVMSMENRKEMATPSRAECAMVSPK